MSKRGSGSSAKLRNGMSRLTGLPETVAKAKEIREIANQAFDKSIDQLKRTEKFFGKQVTKDAIERQESVNVKRQKYSDRIGQILAKAEQNCILMDQITNQNNHEI